MKSKGFTLIELLAVIVILAIIALIATPIILNIINDSKKQSNERSAELYLKAAELAIARENLTGELNISSCDVITETTKGSIEGSKAGDLNCGGKLVKVDIDGTIPTSGKITFTNGKITNLSSYKVGDTKYKLENGSLVADDGTEEETETFTGTIYRSSTKTIKIGDSIAQEPTGKWCAVIPEMGNTCDFGMIFNSKPECEDTLAGEGLSGTCEGQIGGLRPGTYYTEETKSGITTNAYLMHVVEDNIVQESYACLKYSQDEEPACVKGADPNAYGEFDGMSNSNVDDVSDKNPTKNIAEIAKTRSYFLANSGSCSFSKSDSLCSDSSLILAANSASSVKAEDDSVSCQVGFDGSTCAPRS